jgi:hypothetical protein
VGTAVFMCEAPAFHRVPRPLSADAAARVRSKPSRTSSRTRVRHRFHCFHRMDRGFRYSHASKSSSGPFTSVSR